MEIIKEGFNKKCEIAIVIFWKKKKTLKREYGRDRYKNIFEENKQKLL